MKTVFTATHVYPEMGNVVRHWHVTESDAGCIPEAEPFVCDQADMALDHLAHLLADWAQAVPDFDDEEAVYAEGIAECFCTCRRDGRSAEHHDAMHAVVSGRRIRERIGHRVFELACCEDPDCVIEA